jgi:ubiquitin C-terminal hydrolase
MVSFGMLNPMLFQDTVDRGHNRQAAGDAAVSGEQSPTKKNAAETTNPEMVIVHIYRYRIHVWYIR